MMSEDPVEKVKKELEEKEDQKNIKPDPLTVYLKEYESLRAEQLKRLEFQHQAFNYLLIVLGGTISIVAACLKLMPASNDPTHQVIDLSQLLLIVFWLLLFLPLITGPLGFMFFDNEMAIHSIGSHLNWRFKPKVVELIKKNPLLKEIITTLKEESKKPDQDFKGTAVTDENLIFGASLDFFYLSKGSEWFHKWLSRGKWSLFLLPTIGPTILLSFYGLYLFCKNSWRQWFDGDKSIVAAFAILIYLIDVFVCFILFSALWWTSNKHKNPEKSLLPETQQ